jgi:hypothetical protein
VACCSGLAVAAEGEARVTVLDGTASLVVGTRSLLAAEGLRLAEGTLVRTDARCQLMRIEWPDGSLLDLGPATLAMLAPPAAVGSERGFYLLQGWAKFTNPAARRGWAMPMLAGRPAKGAVVLAAGDGLSRCFAETGAQPVLDRGSGRPLALAAGELLGKAAGQPPVLARRLGADLAAQLPRAFRDSLPPRLAALTAVLATRGRDPVAAAGPALTYTELQPWLQAEAPLRQDFAQRFAALLAVPEFRAAVSASLRQHPEWAAALEPQRSRPHGANR